MDNWQVMMLAFHLLALLTGLMYIHHDAVIRSRSGFWSVFPVTFLSWLWVLLWFAVRPPRGGYSPAPLAQQRKKVPTPAPAPVQQSTNQGRLLFGALNELQWQLRLGKLSPQKFSLEKQKLLDELAQNGIRQPFSEVIRELTVLTEIGCVDSEDLKLLEEICQKTGDRIPVATAPTTQPVTPAAPSRTQPLVGASITQTRPQPAQTPPPQSASQPRPDSQPSRPQPAPQPAPVRPAPLQNQAPVSQPRPAVPAQPAPGFHPAPKTTVQPAAQATGSGANSPDFYKHWSTQLLVREFLRTKDGVMGQALSARGLPGNLEQLVKELGATRLIDLYNETKAPELADELRRRRLDRFL